MTHKYLCKINPMISDCNKQWEKKSQPRRLEKFLLYFFVLFYNITFFAKICGEKQTSHILTKKDKQKKNVWSSSVCTRENLGPVGQTVPQEGLNSYSVWISHMITWAPQESQAALPQSGPSPHAPSCTCHDRLTMLARKRWAHHSSRSIGTKSVKRE